MIFFWWIGFLIVLITIGAKLFSFVETLKRWDEETEEKTEADKTIDDLNIINSSKRKVYDEEQRIAKQTYEALEDGAGETSPLTKEIFKKVTGYEDNKDEALNQLIETVLGGLIIGFNAIQNAKLGEEFENDEYVLGYMTGITNYINTIMKVQQGSKEEIETFTYIFKNLFQKPDDAYNKLAKYFYDDHKLFHQGMKDGSEELYDVFSGKKQYIYDFGKYLKEKYGWNK